MSGPQNVGSPPQAWGRRERCFDLGELVRFTPTGVGTALTPSSREQSVAVHPHRRGDGAATRRCATHPSVHPHRRGDGWTWRTYRASSIGSPPQAWGRQRASDDLRIPQRFTPTGVGTARSSGAFSTGRSVHPHRRGDGFLGHLDPPGVRGSPPQAWGRLSFGRVMNVTPRFTPTGVGTAR